MTTVCVGASRPEEQDSYISELHAAMARSRLQNGCVLHLVDHRRAVVQTQFGSERLARPQSPRRACDRTAILVKAGGSNLSLSRQSSKGEIRFFDDEKGALEWLDGGRVAIAMAGHGHGIVRKKIG